MEITIQGITRKFLVPSENGKLYNDSSWVLSQPEVEECFLSVAKAMAERYRSFTYARLYLEPERKRGTAFCRLGHSIHINRHWLESPYGMNKQHTYGAKMLKQCVIHELGHAVVYQGPLDWGHGHCKEFKEIEAYFTMKVLGWTLKYQRAYPYEFRDGDKLVYMRARQRSSLKRRGIYRRNRRGCGIRDVIRKLF